MKRRLAGLLVVSVALGGYGYAAWLAADGDMLPMALLTIAFILTGLVEENANRPSPPPPGSTGVRY